MAGVAIWRLIRRERECFGVGYAGRRRCTEPTNRIQSRAVGGIGCGEFRPSAGQNRFRGLDNLEEILGD